MTDLLERMRGGLVVSVQAAPRSPLAAPEHLAAIARAVEAGGAVGIRTEGVAAVAAIADAVSVPVIGLVKRSVPGSDVYITPELEDAVAVAEAGADLVAVDATERLRPDGRTGADFVAAAVAELPERVLADVDTASAGRAAADAGATAVATSLSGYTGRSEKRATADAATTESAAAPTGFVAAPTGFVAAPTGSAAEPAAGGPDVDLVAELSRGLHVPVLAEGRYATATDVDAAFAAGAFAVVVGTAITDPTALTRRLAAATPAGGDA
jgi:N-acylglucosamine-6-phosphate 2-epimerase